MKILFLHDHKIYKKYNGLYSRGGLSRKVLERYLLPNNDLTLATRTLTQSNIKLMTLLSPGDISFVPIPNLASTNILNYIDAYKKLTQVIAEQDTLIVRLPSFIGVFGLVLAKDKNIIIELVGCPWDSLWNHGSLAGKIMAPIQWLLTKYFVKKSRNVIYVTSEFLQRRYPTDANNAVGCSDVEIELDPSILANRKQYISSVANRKIKIGMIGNLEAKYKGFDTALEAMSFINKEKYVLELVGGGNPADVYNQIKACHLVDCVRIIGTLEHPYGIYDWLDQIDIFIQPSRVEGMPRALIEALSRGCACIGTDAGGIPELLNSANIIKKNDSKKLSHLIINMSTENELLKEAECSIKKAKEFDKDELECKRNIFYKNAGIYDEVEK